MHRRQHRAGGNRHVAETNADPVGKDTSTAEGKYLFTLEPLLCAFHTRWLPPPTINEHSDRADPWRSNRLRHQVRNAYVPVGHIMIDASDGQMFARLI